jgi:hypothetical protein
MMTGRTSHTHKIRIREILGKMRRQVQKQSHLFCIFLLAWFFICFFAVNAQSQKNFLWRAQTRSSTVYILGSIHLLKQDVYPLDRTIENAFEKSDFLAVEADVSDISRIDMGGLLGKALYQGSDALEDHVSRDTYGIVQKEVERLGLPIEFVNKQKPWLLALTLPSMELMNAGYDPNLGIDKYFLTKAQGSKKILELESVDYQIDLLAGLSDNEQELLLLYELKDLEALTQEVDKLVGAWKSGNARTVESFMTKSIADERKFYPIYEKLIIVRNRNMVSKIERYLQLKGIYFVVIGAGHLISNKGIIQLLKDRGYSVEQL